jgi:hypothetical protein
MRARRAVLNIVCAVASAGAPGICGCGHPAAIPAPAAPEFRPPDAPGVNLLRVTRLPLGLQSGWTIDRNSSDGDDVRIEPDRGVRGPSGSASLRIEADKETKIYTAPFAAAAPEESHVASAYFRGEGTVRLSVFGAQSAGERLTLTDNQWQRVSVSFQPKRDAKLLAMVLEIEGEIWLDALQVERGEEATAYAPNAACEVSLLPVEEDPGLDGALPIRVQFSDRPAMVRYAVTGKVPGAVLRGKVVTPYGREAGLPPVRLSNRFLTDGQWRYDRVPGIEHGPFRIEAWVEGSDGEVMGPPNEVVVYRLHRPRHWSRDAADPPFGVHTLSTTRHIRMAKAVGVNWTRLHDAGTRYIGWYHLEPEPGKWQFEDEPIRRYRRHHVQILGLLSTTPLWASYCEQPTSGYFDRYYQPRDPQQFADYVRAVVGRYRGVINAWDIWNEPWVHAFWIRRYDESRDGHARYRTSERPHEDYARLSAAAYAAAKAVDAETPIVGISTTTHQPGERVTSGREWTRGMVAEGALSDCDIIGYHYYTRERLGQAGDGAKTGYDWAIGPIIDAKGRVDKPVWMTEGSPTPRLLGEGFYHHTLPYKIQEDPFDAGDRLSRYLVTLLAEGVDKVFLYSMHCHWYFTSTEYAVLVTPEGYLHPSAAAHSTAAWLLEGMHFVKRRELAEGVTGYLFEAPGRAVIALCPMPNHAPYELPQDAGVRVLDLFGNEIPPGETLDQRVVYLCCSEAPGWF